MPSHHQSPLFQALEFLRLQRRESVGADVIGWSFVVVVVVVVLAAAAAAVDELS